MSMTIESFEALASLLRLKQGPQRAGARLVLVEGRGQADAAREMQIDPRALNNTLRACRAGIERAKKVCESA